MDKIDKRYWQHFIIDIVTGMAAFVVFYWLGNFNMAATVILAFLVFQIGHSQTCNVKTASEVIQILREDAKHKPKT